MSGYMKPYAERTLKIKYKQLGLPDETVDLLHRYFSAFANLYGRLSLKDAYQIIIKHNPKLLTFEKLYEFSGIVRRENQYYFIVDQNELWTDMTAAPESREIVADDLLIFDDEPYYELVKAQHGKPLYIPPKEALLLYEDDGYFEKNQFTVQLETFLKKEKKLYGENLENMMCDLILPINISDNPMEDALKTFDRCGMEFNDKQAEAFVEIFYNIHNHFRKRSNRGYTPSELLMLLPKTGKPPKIVLGDNIRQMIHNGEVSVFDMPNSIIGSENLPPQTKLELLAQLAEINGAQPQPANISRNAPCPCGSGKKYKHCCGKNLS